MQLKRKPQRVICSDDRESLDEDAHSENDETAGRIFFRKSAVFFDKQVGSVVRENAQTPWLDVMRRRGVSRCFQQRPPYAHAANLADAASACLSKLSRAARGELRLGSPVGPDDFSTDETGHFRLTTGTIIVKQDEEVLMSLINRLEVGTLSG